MGPDGKELIPQESPKVNGYGFVATPSPAPGKRVFLFFSGTAAALILMFCAFNTGVSLLV